MKPNVAPKLIRTMLHRCAPIALVAAGAFALVAGCTKHEPTPPRLDLAEAPAQEIDSWIQQQRRLHIKYVNAAGAVTGEKEGGSFEALSAAWAFCATARGTPTGNVCWDEYSQWVGMNICVSRTALSIATVQSESISLPHQSGDGVDETMVLDKITEANAAEIAAYAADYARFAVEFALNTLKAPSVACRGAGTAGTWVTSPVPDSRNMALVFAAGAVDAYYLVRAGYDKAIESTLNVSDAARSSTPSLPEAAGRSILGAAFSRAAAAHLLVGGDPGILGSTTKGYCTNPTLTPQARQALEILRDAAPSPAAISGTGSIQSLLYTSSSEGSVRQRLGAFYALPRFGPGLSAGDHVESYYGLDEKDFVEARNYLMDEIFVFARSWSAKFPPIGSAPGSYNRYAGSAGDRVQALPDGAWAARARYSSQPNRWYDRSGYWPIAPNGNEPVEGTDVGFAPLDTFIGQVHGQIRDLVRKSTDHFGTMAGTPPTATSKEVLGVLGSIVASGEYKGTVELSIAPTKLKAFGHGFLAADKLRVVVGEDGLRCAVQGTIEGADCSDTTSGLTGAAYLFPQTGACLTNPATLACLTAHVLTTDNTGPTLYFGTTSYTGTTAGRDFNTSDIVTYKTRLYVVKPKNPANETPGNFELLAGTTVIAGDNIAIPVVEGINARVARALAPNRKNCALQNVDCVGKSLDQRLPLENELTDNGDAVENSWRHYLDLARQAATESDALGREFQNAKLSRLQSDALTAQRKEEQRQAAANSIDEVQTLCGTNLDSRKLLESLSGGPGQNTLDEVTTTASCPNCSGNGTDTCMGGKCYKNLATILKADPNFVNDPDAARLELCLNDGPTSIQNFVTLGDQPLCVYSRSVWPFDVCPKDIAGVGTDCPKPTSTCITAPTGTKLDVAMPLSYYKNAVAGTGSSTTCQALRQTRFSHAPSDLAKFNSTNDIHPDRFRDRVGHLGFVAGYGGHFAITEDGATRWSSGGITEGPNSSSWPGVSACGPGEAGLFCTTRGSTDAQIGTMNLRVLKAALAAATIRTYDASGLLYDDVPLRVRYPFPWANPSVPSDICNSGENRARSTLYKFGTNAPLTFCSSTGGSYKYASYVWPGGNPTELAWVNPNLSVLRGDLAATDFDLDAGPIASNQDVVKQVFAGLVQGSLAGAARPETLFALLNNAPESTVLWNTLFPYSFETLEVTDTLEAAMAQLDIGNTLDGLELLCELALGHGIAGTKPATLGTLSDIEQAGAYLEQVAQTITERAALTIFANVPKLASEALGDVPPTGAFPALGGQMGEAVSGLRAALVSTRNALPVISSSLQQMGAEMQSLRASLDITDLSKQIIDLDTQSMVMNQLSSCAEALGGIGLNLKPFSAAVACVNSAAQIAIGLQKGSLQQQISDDNAKIAQASFAERMSTLSLNLQQAALGLEQANEEVNGALARIDGLRKQAKVALTRALYLNSYQSQAQVNYDDAIGALASGAQTRYVTALKNAKLMSYYAKRAIEQRLGMALSEMTEDLPLVDAPQTWEGKVCTMGGVMDDPSNAERDWVAVYGEGFIGSYVDQLQAVVESYNLANNFHEGKDVAVVSLRDDVVGIRKNCPSPSVNLLRSSADLTTTTWQPRGCTPKLYNGVTYPAMNCIAAIPADPVGGKADLAVPGLFGGQDAAQGHILRFGDVRFGDLATPCSGTNGPCGWTSGSALTQVVTLTPGRYRFSWYTRDSVVANTSNGASQGIAMVRVAGATGSPALCPASGTQPAVCLVNSPDASASPFVFPQSGSTLMDAWKRASVEFRVTTKGDYEVGFGISAASVPTFKVTVGAPMLETVSNDGMNSLLPAFQATDEQGLTMIRRCEDTNGEIFRRKSWHRDCVRACKAGFEGNCNDGPLYCFQEMSFGVAQSWLQNGKLFNYSGFAKGNFNYRIDSVGLNFVGSNVRNCADATLPSTCYNAGFVPYSVAHTGPFFVRNHVGRDFEAVLFDGHIEHARGLALERYLTNPISSTDRELMGDYMRTEFAGRPLDGNFTVRVWEEPGVDFNAIQDIQLILNYRYWTAFN